MVTMEDPKLLTNDMHGTVSMPREENEEFGSQSALKSGFRNTSRAPGSTHPLENSLGNHRERMFGIQMDMLRRTQGNHVVQREMERSIVKKAAHRLPCLPSTHIADEVLMATDIMISPKDVFNDRMQCEVMGDPHIMMEHRSGLKIL